MSSEFYMNGGLNRPLPSAANDDVVPFKKTARQSFRRAAKSKLWSCDRARFLVAQSSAVRAAQADLLGQLFKEAEKSPTAMAALAWARKNDVAFAVDWQCEANGYYWAGSGLVVISGNMLEEGRLTKAVGTLTHEIRHCWQDMYGMISDPTARFDESFIRTALIEADAYAHGEMAEEEARLHHNRWILSRDMQRASGQACVFAKTIEASCERQEKELADPKQYLWDRFAEWFDSSKSQGYGEMTAEELAYKLKLAGAESQISNWPSCRPRRALVRASTSAICQTCAVWASIRQHELF